MSSTATATLPRISRNAIQAGMTITVEREQFGQQVAQFEVATARKAGDWTVVTTKAGRTASLTNNDVIRVVPAEGEVWA